MDLQLSWPFFKIGGASILRGVAGPLHFLYDDRRELLKDYRRLATLLLVSVLETTVNVVHVRLI